MLSAVLHTTYIVAPRHSLAGTQSEMVRILTHCSLRKVYDGRNVCYYALLASQGIAESELEISGDEAIGLYGSYFIGMVHKSCS